VLTRLPQVSFAVREQGFCTSEGGTARLPSALHV